MERCTLCGKLTDLAHEGKPVCEKCREKIEDSEGSYKGTKKCSRCGQAVPRSAQFCPRCGLETGRKKPKKKEEKETQDAGGGKKKKKEQSTQGCIGCWVAVIMVIGGVVIAEEGIDFGILLAVAGFIWGIILCRD
ncbi:MAG: zinc-ribbon domain-containing protein [Planctomycetota bacterium]|jgi:RNA polymerase subunit RPABC4/transcription elongation factor Spt4